MSAYKSDFLQILDERGFIHQLSSADGLDRLLRQENVTAYIGFDCTARSLHIGSLVQIMALYWLQKTGHRPVTLMGGGTSMIGDPSGKDESRVMLSIEEIEKNRESLCKVFSRFVKFGADSQNAVMLDNAEWLTTLNYVDFLRKYGKNFSVNQMLARDSVKNRLGREQHLSFLEFNYMIFQAYDFIELYRRYGCRLQMGGSDQWGNIISGVELGRRSGTEELFALTTPLLATSSGIKMGKTAKGTVWMAEDMLSPYDYWQYWRNCEDTDTGRFLKLFTVLPLDEIARLEALKGEEKNEAKKILATEVTAMAHGRKVAEQAMQTARITFEKGITSYSLPKINIKKEHLEEGVGLLSLIVKAGFSASNSEARRHVRAGAIRVNNIIIEDERMILDLDNLGDHGAIKLSMGKKRHILVQPD